ncbi:MAG TPA: TetR/AcrR family transcriptional regulator [Acidimicrobiales bacterium]|jgi:AcrR family transcriptional regulator|nr:TetR/AcrR family transcriptional regulator [Acidimicrobiales bacterium]
MPKVVDAAQRRSEITDAASRLIARAGIEAATMREVAAEAGWTTGAVMHYFADKRELLLTTFQESLSRRRSRRPPGATTSPAERLRASLEGALPVDEERRRHWLVTLACCLQASGDAKLAAAQRDAYREFRDHVAAMVLESGGAPDGEQVATAERLIALADGIAVQALFDPAGWPPRRQLAALDTALGEDRVHF